MKNGPYELIVPPDDYPGKRYRGKYAYEHRINWWKGTGKNPDDFPNHVIHHRDDKKRNNKPTNLELKEWAEHTSHHARPITFRHYICLNCNKPFSRRAKGLSQRNRPKFCSRQCIGFYCGVGRPMNR
jgi:hypothetical protein